MTTQEADPVLPVSVQEPPAEMWVDSGPVSVQEPPAEMWVDSGLPQGQGH